jgi:nucleotide-binding universal stress UspA family protein
MTIKRIVVGIDGSQAADRALRWAAGLSHDVGADVVAVYALHPMGEVALSLPPFWSVEWRQELQREMDDIWCAPLREAEVRYRSLLVEHSPVAGLVAVAEREDADLIVVGDDHGLADRVLGGVGHHLPHHTRRPVVIVPDVPV